MFFNFLIEFLREHDKTIADEFSDMFRKIQVKLNRKTQTKLTLK